MKLKTGDRLAGAAPLEETAIRDAGRYRVKSLPAAGAVWRAEDRGEGQLGLDV